MPGLGGGPKPVIGRGLPKVAAGGSVDVEPPAGLEGLAAEMWRVVAAANSELPAARSVSLALLCSQLAELSRLRSYSNSVEDLNMTSDGLKQLAATLDAGDVDPELRATVSEQRRILVAIRDSAIKRQSAEQVLVLSIAKLEEDLGIASVILEDETKVNLAIMISEGTYRGKKD